MNRSIKISKQRPADWSELPEEGRHWVTVVGDDGEARGWGICDIQVRGRETVMSWVVNGPKPVKVASKRKHRRPV